MRSPFTIKSNHCVVAQCRLSKENSSEHTTVTHGLSEVASHSEVNSFLVGSDY